MTDQRVLMELSKISRSLAELTKVMTTFNENYVKAQENFKKWMDYVDPEEVENPRRECVRRGSQFLEAGDMQLIAPEMLQVSGDVRSVPALVDQSLPALEFLVERPAELAVVNPFQIIRERSLDGIAKADQQLHVGQDLSNPGGRTFRNEVIVRNLAHDTMLRFGIEPAPVPFQALVEVP